MTAESGTGAPLGRRDLLVGGAAVIATGGVLAAAGTAAQAAVVGDATAAHAAVAGDGTAPGVIHFGAEPLSSPVTTTIASSPTSGYTYRDVCMYDFVPFDPNALKTWGGSGTYSAGTATSMRATVEIPAGALVRDIEYYIFNSSGSSVFPDTYLYVPGMGTISSIGASAAVASTGTITANRVTATQQGPYPLGARLLVSLSTPTAGTVQINGARVGFTQGAGATALLDTPVRAYDSRNGDGKIPGNSTRTITLPSSVVRPGTTGVIVNITAVDGDGIGFMKIWPANAGEPAASAINFPAGAPIANAMVVGVSNDRKINIRVNVAVDVIVDITGTVA